MTWHRAFPLSELARGARLFKRGPRQVALFLVNGAVHAVDNRCPHEGYPLVQGDVGADGLLTCRWHNWKFRLGDGVCVLGGEDVRHYPTEARDGDVWVDLADPPLEVQRERLLGALRGAFDDRDQGRISRALARLELAGIPGELGVAQAIVWAHDRLEYGTGHAFAGAADWLGRASTLRDDPSAHLVCLAEPIDHLAFDTLRQPRFPYAGPGEPFTAEAFLEAVEREDRERAEGLVARALTDGLGFTDLEDAFTRAALAHFQDFGHSLIYVQKTRELIERLTSSRTELPAIEPLVLPALARHLCYTTREDLLPEFAAYRPIADAVAALGRRAAADAADHAAASDVDAEQEQLLEAHVRAALGWVRDRLERAPVGALYDALLAAAAHHLLHVDTRFQEAWDRPVSDSIGWLDFTHAITFGSAVRIQCERFPSLWPIGLLQMACFAGRNVGYLDLEIDEERWTVADPGPFLAETHETLLDHGLRDPIFAVHLLKTTCAVERELPHATPRCRRLLLAGLNRFLHSPLKQKHARRLAHQALELVGRDHPSTNHGTDHA